MRVLTPQNGSDVVSVSLVAGDPVGVLLLEQVEDLAGIGVTPGFVLGVEKLTVHSDVEDAFLTGCETQRFDDVLVVVEQVVSRAHGAC